MIDRINRGFKRGQKDILEKAGLSGFSSIQFTKHAGGDTAWEMTIVFSKTLHHFEDTTKPCAQNRVSHLFCTLIWPPFLKSKIKAIL